MDAFRNMYSKKLFEPLEVVNQKQALVWNLFPWNMKLRGSYLKVMPMPTVSDFTASQLTEVQNYNILEFQSPRGPEILGLSG